MRSTALAALCAVAGCLSPCGDAIVQEQPLGTFAPISAPTPDLESATIDLGSHTLILTYVDGAGRAWRVVYDIEIG